MSEATHRLVLFGHPVAHSLSPVIQQAFAAQCGMTLDYDLVDVAPANFPAAVHAFFTGGGFGANVTVPHKRSAFELAEQASEAAQRAGVANVLYRDAAGRLCCDNTDGSGLVADLEGRRHFGLAGKRILLLGAGGAARGVLGPLLNAGPVSLVIANRTLARAEALAAAHGEPVQAVAMDDLGELAAFDLVLHATSAGHAGSVPAWPTSLLAPGTLCVDLSYGTAAAPFLRWARAGGAQRAFDGLGMLVEQAAQSFERWFGKTPQAEPVYARLSAGQFAA